MTTPVRPCAGTTTAPRESHAGHRHAAQHRHARPDSQSASERAPSTHLSGLAVHHGHVALVERQPRVHAVAHGPQHVQRRRVVIRKPELHHLARQCRAGEGANHIGAYRERARCAWQPVAPACGGECGAHLVVELAVVVRPLAEVDDQEIVAMALRQELDHLHTRRWATRQRREW